MTRFALILAMAALMLSGGCDRRSDDGPVVVSAIGTMPRLVDPSAGPMSRPQQLLMNATAQGLVRFDAQGQVEPGLAQRWIVIDDGKSYIFRLNDAEWPDGSPVTAGDVVAVLDRARADGSGNPLHDFLANIDDVEAMTDLIVEVRLRRPVPGLLTLLAQPELAMVRQRDLGGSGPMRARGRERDHLVLTPVFDPARNSDAEFTEPGPEQTVLLRGERASNAIARFKMRDSDLVSGGTVRDWPLLGIAGIAPANIQVEPVDGLFGLAIVSRQGFLAEVDHRQAIAMAIDRPTLTAAFSPGWSPVETVVPQQFGMASPPAVAPWSTLDLTQRRALARQRVSRWQRSHPGPVPLRVALPDRVGGTLLFKQLFLSLKQVGVRAIRVGMPDDADLRLVDSVAPMDNARWYLTLACRLCDSDTVTLIDAARDAPTLEARGQRLSEADAALAAEGAFMPIAHPFRWSLVALRLGNWQGNTRGRHPLNRLRNESN